MRHDGLRLAAPAKVNLFLGVMTQQDSRGYHYVDSVMVALTLSDEVCLEPANDFAVHMDSCLDVPVEKSNVWKAARSLASAYGIEPQVHISVRQHIPLQAGLGGSSSDAGTTLRGLCRLWNINLKDPRVTQVARSIGADVSFFLDPHPSFLTGAGDVLKETFPYAPSAPIVLVKPLSGISTAEAYAGFDQDPVPTQRIDGLLCAMRSGDLSQVVAHMSNNLGIVACRLLPAIGEVHSWLVQQTGVSGAMVSGSGSCVFGICKTAKSAQQVAQAAAERGWWSYATQITHVSKRQVC